MKNILFLISLACLGLFSCKKDHSKDNAPKSGSQKVSFNVGFSKSSGSFQTNSSKLQTNSIAPDTSLTNYVSVIYYMIFDSTGKELSYTTQRTTDTAFGHFTTNLHTGKYTIAIAAGGTDLTATPEDLSIADIHPYSSLYGGQNYGYFKSDAFFKRLTVTVGVTSSTQNVVLDRITSKLVININDAIPAGATTAYVSYSSGSQYYVGTDQKTVNNAYGGNGYIYTIPASAIGTKNYQLDGGTFLSVDASLSVKILFTNDKGDALNNISPGSDPGAIIYGQKTVVAAVQPDKISVLSGNLFGGAGGSSTGSFQVTLDSAWNTPIIKTFP